jgi:Ca-activated chloride channel family protein
MKRLSLGLVLSVLFVLFFSFSQAQTYVQLVLDASGSMWNKLDDGTYRITAAKDVLGNFIKGLPTGDLNVGLRVYGANIAAMDAGACDDIVLVVPMDGVDKPGLQTAVDNTKAKGATPIVKALEQAAADFPADAAKKLIVLVTDGEESCGGDLSAVAEKLKAQGIEIDLKIIGFALSDRAQQSFAGIGEFVNAADAASLASALETAVEEVVVEESAPVAREAVTLTVPATAPAGQFVDVSYDAPGLVKEDYLTIVPAGSDDDALADSEYIDLQSKTTKLTTPFEAGEYEVRYVGGSAILARASITLEKSDITMRPLSEINAGGNFEVEWTGPNGESDYITIVKPDAPEGSYDDYERTEQGSPLTLVAPTEPGQYELRYTTDRSGDAGKIFARVPVEVLEAVPVFLQAAPEAPGGSNLEIEWAGPVSDTDFITIVPATAGEGTYEDYKYAKDIESPVTLVVPVEPGDYEVRYVNDREGKVLGRIPLKVTASTTTLQVSSSEAMAGTMIEVSVTGATGDDDFITIVKADADEGSYDDYYYPRDKTSGMLQTSFEAGNYEARLVNEREGKVVTRLPITLSAPVITLTAPAEIAVNTDFEVSYTAPASERSYIAIVPASAGESEYGSSYSYTTGASGSMTLRAPETPGSYELRYLTPENKAIYSIPITVK